MDKIVLEAKGLTKTYREEGGAPNKVLHALDLEVRSGEFIVVVGPSGSGKSTLLNLLGLMDKPTAGEVRLFGRPTARLAESERDGLRNRGIGFVFQFDSLIHEFTVLENVVIPGRIAASRAGGRPDALETRGLELLDKLGIKKLAHRFPTRLSGGERQRAAIARALFNNPGVILADEPTGNLDRRNGELVFDILKELTESLNVAVVAVTHNEHAAMHASRTIHLSDGRIVKSPAQ